jgi:hypothetical protein
MAKLGAGGRLKGKLDNSTWVDSTEWLIDDSASDRPVEFLEVEPAAYRLSDDGAPPPPSRFSSGPSSRLALIGAVGAALVAVFLMSRPDGGEDALSQLPYEQQQEILQRRNGETPATTAPVVAAPVQAEPEPEVAAEPLGRIDPAVPLAERLPIPALSDDLPADLPGVLALYGDAGSVVFIRRDAAVPQELALNRANEPITATQIVAGDTRYGTPVVAADQEFGWANDPDGDWYTRMVAAERLLPSDDGVALVDRADRVDRQIVRLVNFDQINNGAAGAPIFELQPNDVPIGGWQGHVVLGDGGGGSIYLLDESGVRTKLADAVPVAYDGRTLVAARCTDGDEGACRLLSGPIDETSVQVDLPEQLVDHPLPSGQADVAVSPDGSRLAVFDPSRNAEMAWIDLNTGAYTTRRLGFLAQPPLAWSPDGRWLASASNGNVVVWDTESNDTALIVIGRPVSSLVWFELDGDG